MSYSPNMLMKFCLRINDNTKTSMIRDLLSIKEVTGGMNLACGLAKQRTAHFLGFTFRHHDAAEACSVSMSFCTTAVGEAGVVFGACFTQVYIFRSSANILYIFTMEMGCYAICIGTLETAGAQGQSPVGHHYLCL